MVDAEQPAGFELDERTDQFITRRIGKADSLTTELVIRLCNDFPTTEREAKDFEERFQIISKFSAPVVPGCATSIPGMQLCAGVAFGMQDDRFCTNGRQLSSYL